MEDSTKNKISKKSEKVIARKSKETGISIDILRQVYRRGMAAWNTGHRPGVSQQAWSYGRINSFATGKGGARKADADLWKKAKTQMKKPKKTLKEFQQSLHEAEYKGKKVTLDKPFRTPDGPKKFGVYVRNDKGNVVLVRFGDPNMEIKRDDPERRKSFRARHNCSDPGPKWKARYWACKTWEKGKTVSDIVEESTGKTPPGYRQGDFGKSCGNCKAYDEATGMCVKYEVRVAGNAVCDTWTPVYKSKS